MSEKLETDSAPLSQLNGKRVELETFDMTSVQHNGCLASDYVVETEREVGFGASGVGILHVNGDEFQLQTRSRKTILGGKVKAISVIKIRGKVVYKGSLEETPSLSPEEVWGE